MLVRFSVENCLSFRDRTELSMIASGKVRRHPEHVIRTGGQHGVPVLKLAVIYGANASGKSNLVKAMAIARDLILIPTEASRRIALTPFKLDPDSTSRPSRFEFEIKLDDRCFAYGFSVSAKRVEEEWLFEIGRSLEDRIFERSRSYFEWGNLEFSNPDEKAFLEFTAKGTLPNRLFLTECRERNVRTNVPGAKDIVSVLSWFEASLNIVLPTWWSPSLVMGVYSDKSFKADLTNYLKCFDTGIEDLDLEMLDPDSVKIPDSMRRQIEAEVDSETMMGFAGSDGPHYLWGRDGQGLLQAWKLVSRRRARSKAKTIINFDMAEESDGTRRLMHLVPAMISLMTGNRVLVVDEFDRSLHPDILHSYVANFLKYTAGRNSQLIVTTHDTTLLKQRFLRRDEVWFVDKGKDQSSRLIALEEYKNAHKSKDLQQDYLQGRFGGVPVIRDFTWLGEAHGERA